MVRRAQVYRCETCGNMVFGLHGGKGELVCCGKPMTLLEEKTADWTTEKHVPVIEKTDAGIKVTVGSTPHPMELTYPTSSITTANLRYDFRRSANLSLNMSAVYVSRSPVRWIIRTSGYPSTFSVFICKGII